MTIREEIKTLIQNIIKKLQKSGVFPQFEVPEIKVERPEEKAHGDYSTNIVMVIAKQIKKNPMEIADYVIKELKTQKAKKFFEKIEIAKPGFINFWLTQDTLEKLFLKILVQGPKVFQKKPKKKETIVIEYSSPNIAKPLGVHHIRSTIIGQALVNILRFYGHKVISLSFPGDWGTQFGLLIAGYKHWGDAKKLKKNPIAEMLKIYVRFSQAAKKNPELLKEGQMEFKKLEQGDVENKKLWQWFAKESYRDFNRVYKLLDVKIENTIGESFYEPELKCLIKEALKKGLALYGKDGSVIIHLQDSSIPEIIQKSDGATIYTTRELAAIAHRLKKFRASKIIYVAANQQAFHLSQVFGAAVKLGIAKKNHLIHVKFGMMLGPGGKKFATREGKLIPLEEVLKEAIKRAKKKVEKLNSSLSKKEKENIAKIVGIGAVKFFDLSHNRLRDIIFDWDQMLNLKGFSAPYIQYTYARLSSILRKAKFKKKKNPLITITHPLEKEVILTILCFVETIERVAENYFPNQLADYLYELSNVLNNFYETLPVLKVEKNKFSSLSEMKNKFSSLSEMKNKRQFRLNLVCVSKEILETGLNLLGISAPEKM